jgi:hypothetical protein
MGYEIYFFRFFLNFFIPNGQKIEKNYIQTVKFVFKQSNLNSNGSIRSWQRTTTHRLQWRAVVRVVPPRRYHQAWLQCGRYRQCRPPHHLPWAVPPSGLVLPHWGRVVALPTETSLRRRGVELCGVCAGRGRGQLAFWPLCWLIGLRD